MIWETEEFGSWRRKKIEIDRNDSLLMEHKEETHNLHKWMNGPANKQHT